MERVSGSLCVKKQAPIEPPVGGTCNTMLGRVDRADEEVAFGAMYELKTKNMRKGACSLLRRVGGCQMSIVAIFGYESQGLTCELDERTERGLD